MEETVHTPDPQPTTDAIDSDPVLVKCYVNECVRAISSGAKSRELSLAITKLQEAAMWIDEHLRQN